MNQDMLMFLSKMKNFYSRNQQVKEDKQKKGESYNIFTILGLWSEEVRLHSSFISNLLDPNGSHGLNDGPLQLFIELLKQKDPSIPNDLDFCSAKITPEKFIGPVDYENKTGGRIDIEILFEKNNYVIVIENKIYAGDQLSQLIRYRNYAEESYSQRFCICYLTIDGHDPSRESSEIKQDEEPYWLNLSYKYDINKWLFNCIAFATRMPLIREVLFQYKNLIDKISGNTIEENMIDEYVNYLLKGENLCFAETIQSAINPAKSELIKRDLIPYLKNFASENDLEIDSYLDEKAGCFKVGFITKERVIICVENNANFCNFFYGIKFKDNIEPIEGIREKIISFYKGKKEYGSQKIYPMWSYLDKYTWTSEELVNHMNEIIKEIKEKILQTKDDLKFITNINSK